MNTTAGNEEKSARKLWFASAVFIMVLTLGIGLFVCSKKHVEFCDESLSLESANAVWKEHIYDDWNRWMSGEEIRSYYAATDINPHLIIIMKKLWVDHVPFYFWLLRFASLLAYGSSSPWIGMGLNLFLTLLFELWLFVSLGKRYGDDRRVLIGAGIFCLLFFLTMPLFFSQLNLIRMYLLITFELWMLLWYMGGWYMEKEKKKRQFPYVLTVACALITHYLFLPFFGLLCICIFLSLLAKDRKRIPQFIGMNASAAIVSCILDPYWIYRLFRYNLMARSGGGADSGSSFGKILIRVVKTLGRVPFSENFPYFPGFLIACLVLAGALFLLWRNGHKKLFSYVIFVTAADLFYLFLVYRMNGGAGRYHWPASVIWLLLVYLSAIGSFLFLLGRAGKDRWPAVLPAAVLVLFLGINLYGSIGQKIEFLNPVSVEEELERRYSEIPWLVYSHEHTYYEEGAAYKFMIPERICFISPDHPADTDFVLPEEFIVVTGDESLPEALAYLEELSGRQSVQTEEALMWGSMGAWHYRLRSTAE
ncbi:MAG: hypothetical protein K5697_17075 [Lachnospiraceae bacterium]|nr:hypothetical protein [Lachnospiraceae bacterium]